MGKKKLTRREFLKDTAVVTAAAAVGPHIFVRKATAASNKKLVICSYGGSYQTSQRKAFFEPFQKATGIKVVEATGPDLAKIKAQVTSGNVEWDVVDIESRIMYTAITENLLEPIDTSIVKLNTIVRPAIHKYGIGNIAFTTALTYNKKQLKKAPKGWADFWDVKNFPGPRSLQDHAPFNLEFALIADGVDKDKLYPLDIDRAFKKMSQIKGNIDAWWESGAQSIQQLTSGAVVMSSAWNGRVNVAQSKGVPLEIVWDGAAYDWDLWAVPKGTPRRELAMQFIQFALDAKRQAYQCGKLIAYGPSNKLAYNYIEKSRQKQLPTYPGNLAKQFSFNSKWWQPRLNKLNEKWAAWKIS